MAAWATRVDGSGKDRKGPRASMAEQLQNASVCTEQHGLKKFILMAEHVAGPGAFCSYPVLRGILGAGRASQGGVARWQLRISCLANLSALCSPQ